ncbi:MAG: AAA family ATPase [Thermoplasmatales archaeon I-plasma]|nr:MAG: AAA family ATPase [Thermoplasmatales archaeon I-plasma]
MSIIDPGVRNPLYGRSLTQMRVGKWMDSSTSINFLREGCRQNGIPFRGEEMAEVAGKLGGMPGWLTLFGHQYAISGDTKKALRTVRTQAMRIVGEELENASKVAMGWERELGILKEIGDGGRRFSELQDRFKMRNAPLSRNLQMLMRLEYVEKDVNGMYVISDPMVEEYLRKSKATVKRREF